MVFDLALVKLSEPFPPFLNDSRHYLINTICLTNATQTLGAYNETAYAFGYGMIDNTTQGYNLQTAEVQLSSKDCYGYMLCAFSSGDESKICEVIPAQSPF